MFLRHPEENELEQVSLEQFENQMIKIIESMNTCQQCSSSCNEKCTDYQDKNGAQQAPFDK